MNFDYESTYLNLYKKLPMINAISAYVLVIAWAIVDWAEWIVFGEFLGFLIWLGIGAPFAVLVGFITMLSISATVVRTDSAIEMKKMVKNKSMNQTSFSESDFNNLPKL